MLVSVTWPTYGLTPLTTDLTGSYSGKYVSCNVDQWPKTDRTCGVLPCMSTVWSTTRHTRTNVEYTVCDQVSAKSDEYSNSMFGILDKTCTMCLISYRPSDKRSPGKDPRLQYAFENQVLGVSCISHRLTQLAAFFIDQRTEWSTVCSCTCI